MDLGEAEEAEQLEEVPVEEGEPWEESLIRLKQLVYTQPDVLFSIFLELLDLLVARDVIKKEDVEPLIKAGMSRWME